MPFSQLMLEFIGMKYYFFHAIGILQAGIRRSAILGLDVVSILQDKAAGLKVILFVFSLKMTVMCIFLEFY